ncbi:EAL domain-containing protein [Thioalbus denitrificans]|uniref:PAS domain S-box-containing protein/diguanylate cyclase (GGDEF)-like protein n=1 Tax=Thioalbus denitrificans TaxID=547122 RepID=A0A369BTG1_9GAMM|nr:EAL domain-containing protein [Thioalbus denitrificans]RCX24940.1 PAS domain S-box-containing protein/diguanylate cyclase (GGDEF)-like protein [Thioalbus denitrificans]
MGQGDEPGRHGGRNELKIVQGVTLLLALVVTVYATLGTWETYRLNAALHRAEIGTNILYAVLQTGPSFALERGWTSVYMGRPLEKRTTALEHLERLRQAADLRWQCLLTGLDRTAGPLLRSAPVRTAYTRLVEARMGLDLMRKRADKALASDGPTLGLDEVFLPISNFNAALWELAQAIYTSTDGGRLLELRDYRLSSLAWRLAEFTGQSRAIVGYFLSAEMPLDNHAHDRLQGTFALAEEALDELTGLEHAGLTETAISRNMQQIGLMMGRGFSSRLEAILGTPPDTVPDGDAETWMSTATTAVNAVVGLSDTLIAATRERSVHTLGGSDRIFIFNGLLLLAVGLLTPLSLVRSRRSATLLFERKELAEVTLRSIGDGVITTDAEMRIEHLNPIAEQLTGWSAREARGQPLDQVFRILNRYTREALPTPVQRCLASRKIVGLSSDTLLLRRDGTEVIIQDSAAPIRDNRGRIVGAVMVFYDVLHPWTGEHLLSYHATHDPVTALANRWEFERHLLQAVGETQDGDAQHALCYLDVDQFKVVNDTCGHAEGDDLLRRLSSHLKGGLPPGAFLARLGGDEFGLLLRDCPLEEAVKTADGLREAAILFRFPCAHGQGVHRVSLSIGVVPVTRDSPSPAELLSQADAACYAAKDKGRNRVQVFVPGDREMSVLHGEMRWVTLLQEALEHDRLELHCQEIRPLAAGRPGYCEVLVRMQGEAPGQQPIPPGHFIPAAERYNLMPGLDRWVIEHTFRVLADPRLRALAPNQPLCSINLSGDSLRRHEMIDFIIDRLRHHAIPGDRVCFEITETSAIGSLEQAVTFIESLRAQGCHFALDDFGTGLSSFTYLKRLPVDCVKIDGSFIRDLQRDPTDQAMVRAIHVVAQAMGKYTVAEWVEDAGTLEMLRGIGIDFVQGFHVDKPKPIAGYLDSLEHGAPEGG